MAEITRDHKVYLDRRLEMCRSTVTRKIEIIRVR